MFVQAVRPFVQRINPAFTAPRFGTTDAAPAEADVEQHPSGIKVLHHFKDEDKLRDLRSGQDGKYILGIVRVVNDGIPFDANFNLEGTTLTLNRAPFSLSDDEASKLKTELLALYTRREAVRLNALYIPTFKEATAAAVLDAVAASFKGENPTRWTHSSDGDEVGGRGYDSIAIEGVLDHITVKLERAESGVSGMAAAYTKKPNAISHTLTLQKVGSPKDVLPVPAELHPRLVHLIEIGHKQGDVSKAKAALDAATRQYDALNGPYNDLVKAL